MQKNKPTFRISRDDDRPDSLFQARRKELHIEKLNRRITLMAIFFILVLAALTALGYLNLKRKFDSINIAGANEVKKLSENLESSFSSLSVKFAKMDYDFKELQETFAKKVKPMEEIFLALDQTSSSLKGKISTIEKNMEALDAAKAEKENIEAVAADIRETLTPLQADVEKIKGDISAFHATIANEMNVFAERMDGAAADLKKLETAVSSLASRTKNAVTDEALNLALRNQQNIYQVKIDLMTKRLEQAEADVKALEKRLAASARPATRQPAGGTAASSSAAPAPKPGAIIEQDLQ